MLPCPSVLLGIGSAIPNAGSGRTRTPKRDQHASGAGVFMHAPLEIGLRRYVIDMHVEAETTEKTSIGRTMLLADK